MENELTIKDRNKMIDVLLKAANKKPTEYINTFDILKKSPEFEEKIKPTSKWKESGYCSISELALKTGLFDSMIESPGVCESQFLIINQSGIDLLNEYGRYSHYLQYNRRKTRLEILKIKYWWAIFLSGFVIAKIPDMAKFIIVLIHKQPQE